MQWYWQYEEVFVPFTPEESRSIEEYQPGWSIMSSGPKINSSFGQLSIDLIARKIRGDPPMCVLILQALISSQSDTIFFEKVILADFIHELP